MEEVIFDFYPRPPRGGRQLPVESGSSHRNYFYPRPPRGGRHLLDGRRPPPHYFYPRPPRGGRLGKSGRPSPVCADFYPRPPRGGRPLARAPALDGWTRISTHALREEGDSSRSSRRSMTSKFLPTPSARRATRRGYSSPSPPYNFYPRPPRGGRRGVTVVDYRGAVFLPTPSARRATQARGHAVGKFFISTHALREEGDRIHRPSGNRSGYFYPRPPRGGRRPGRAGGR